ncbi:Tyrosyl-DNA phosphodiesterase [Lachnellula hyalina]|uniref:Tyrosyl-DNA phosphodiesterase n=1 Tax=Lachnellula hyalina TaxID=1316788 RepID=A0A8H8R608_9HELO|nr:Tyrosyl-DNA phosphodiesterase [Lachnellula hyalina]TVY28988.1 Tyrosyl-DNA phosphodiesterase [Lachnellula hyalina]
MSGSDSDYDEDTKKAIALSLQEPSPESRISKIVDLVSEDDDDDLDAPVTSRASQRDQRMDSKNDGLSAIDTGSNTKIETASNRATPLEIDQNIPMRQAPLPSNGYLGSLNRKQMEEERRARAQSKQVESQGSNTKLGSRKREAPTSPPAPHNREGRQVVPKLSHEPSTGLSLGRNKPGKAALSGHATTPIIPPTQEKNKLPKVLSSNDPKKASTPGIQYPDGAIKKTWVYGCPRQGDDIKIEEVFQKKDLELAVLSSFQIDPAWVEAKLDSKTKIIWVLQEKDEAEKEKLRSEAAKNQRFCFPSMEGNINCMHSKLQLLAHPSHLRIVVPSANLVPYDWGETGVMENVCFLIDLPRNPDGELTELGKLTHFATELIYFLTALGLDQKIIDSMRKFDFSRTAHLGFVHSIGGSHTGSGIRRTGYCGLGTAVQQLGLDTEKALSVDFAAASIGNLNIDLIKCLYLALQGDNGMSEYERRISKQVKGKGKGESTAELQLSKDLASLFRIYFPTSDTVGKSRGGKDAGGTICFQSNWYNSNSFPRSLLRDSKSQRDGLLMHNKMIFVRPHEAIRGHVAWAYVGSANLSESAWGRLVKDRTTKEAKLNLRNWECGVIFPVAGAETQDQARGQGPPGMEVFKDKIPVPMIVPGEEYSGRKPWFYTEQQ